MCGRRSRRAKLQWASQDGWYEEWENVKIPVGHCGNGYLYGLGLIKRGSGGLEGNKEEWFGGDSLALSYFKFSFSRVGARSGSEICKC